MSDINQAINLIAEKLSVPANGIYEALIRQAPITATIMAASLLIVFAILTAFTLFLLRYSKSENSDEEVLMVLFSVLFGVSLVFLIVVIVCLPEIVSGYFNPQYWALKDILGALK